jgi:hypothetical protein
MPDLREAIAKFASDLATRMENFVSDVSTLEVRTYTTPSDQAVALFQNKADITAKLQANAALRALTTVSFDGDTTNWVPVSASGEVDKSLWDLHQQAVKGATENRAATITAVANAATGALKAVQSLGKEPK